MKNYLLVGFILLLSACATTENALDAQYSNETSAQKGTRYLLGRGVKQDDAQAFYYFKQAAHAGDPFAANELAYLYAAGKGTDVDQKQALVWYQKAAEQGLASAAYNTGLMYFYGIGTAKNHAQGLTWIKQSADKNFAPAKQFLEKTSA